MKKDNTWQTVYRLAADLYRLRPWTYLSETDVFGVMIPGTGKKYFLSIMGSEGTMSALSAYEETTALGQFWALEENGTADSGDVLSISHLILSFEKESDIDPDQLKRIRSMETDFGFTVEFPEVRKIIPGQFPADPDETQLNDLAFILEQAIDVCSRAAGDPDFIHPPDMDDEMYLLREQVKHGDNISWTDKYRRIKIKPLHYKYIPKQKDIDELISLPASQAIMQAHFQMMPLPVKEEGKPGFFPFIVLLVNKKSGIIENSHMAVADPDYETMLGTIPKIFLDFIKTLGFRPRSVEVKSPLLLEMLQNPLKQCDIRLLQFKQLVAMEEAIEGILKSIQKEK